MLKFITKVQSLKQHFLYSSLIFGLISLFCSFVVVGQSIDSTKTIFESAVNNSINVSSAFNLLSFTANNNGAYNYLAWKLASQANIAHIVVERSTDGNSFLDINNIIVNISIKNYNYQDTKPAADKNYYRLKIVDTNNLINYSTVATVINKSTIDLQILYDAQSGKVTVAGMQNNRTYQLEIYSCNGQLVSKKNNNTTQLVISISDLPHGLYVAYASDGTTATVSRKIIW